MDERKKTIGELEFKKKESLRSLEILYEDFGEALFSRFPGQETLLGETAEEYLKFQKEIADSQDLIQLAEADNRRLSDLDAEILSEEREDAALKAEIPGACADVGRDAVQEESFVSVLGLYRQQANQIIPRLEEAKAKLDELEDRAGPGFLGWVGRNTQGTVYRALAAKHQSSLKKVYIAAGEQLAAPEHEALVFGHDVEDAVRSLRDMKESAAARIRVLEELREERRRLKVAFGAEGGPLKRIQNLEKHIAFIRSELKTVYRRLGEQAAGQGQEFQGLFQPEDQQIIEAGRQHRETIAGYNREIEKLKTAITIDEKKAEIEKMKRAVTEQQQRITRAEERIREINAQIEETEARIEELSKLL
ncbi:MAG: hypothetical protein LBI94_09875 [Treponema sp.]|nr:hypothetical protein [Treponema sp.]